MVFPDHGPRRSAFRRFAFHDIAVVIYVDVVVGRVHRDRARLFFVERRDFEFAAGAGCELVYGALVILHVHHPVGVDGHAGGFSGRDRGLPDVFPGGVELVQGAAEVRHVHVACPVDRDPAGTRERRRWVRFLREQVGQAAVAGVAEAGELADVLVGAAFQLELVNGLVADVGDVKDTRFAHRDAHRFRGFEEVEAAAGRFRARDLGRHPATGAAPFGAEDLHRLAFVIGYVHVARHLVDGDRVRSADRPQAERQA